MSDSVRPRRQQPTRFPRPWDSPGKNIGVGCHFLLQCMKVKSESEVAQSCPTLSDTMEPTRLLRPWDFPGKSTGVGCHRLLRCLWQDKLNQNWNIHNMSPFVLGFPQCAVCICIIHYTLIMSRQEKNNPFLLNE